MVYSNFSEFGFTLQWFLSVSEAIMWLLYMFIGEWTTRPQVLPWLDHAVFFTLGRVNATPIRHALTLSLIISSKHIISHLNYFLVVCLVILCPTSCSSIFALKGSSFTLISGICDLLGLLVWFNARGEKKVLTLMMFFLLNLNIQLLLTYFTIF